MISKIANNHRQVKTRPARRAGHGLLSNEVAGSAIGEFYNGRAAETIDCPCRQLQRSRGRLLELLGGALDTNRDGSALEDIIGTISRTSGRGQGEVFPGRKRRMQMSVAKVSEISATSSKGFEDAIQQGLSRASKTLRDVRSAWVKEQHVRCDNGKVVEYQVNMMVTFVLDE